MGPLATIRRRRLAWGRSVLGTFVAAWLSLVLQPCAMAMEETDHDCPHCPPAVTQVADPCDVGVGPACGLDDQLSAEPRSNPLKLKDLSNELPVAIGPAFEDLSTVTRQSQTLPANSVLFDPGGPPRNVLFCVYLK